MPDLQLRAWAIDRGDGQLLVSDTMPWCPARMFTRPATADRALRRVRKDWPKARVVRVRVTIEVLHDEQ